MEDIGAEIAGLRKFLVAHARKKFYMTLDDAEDAVQQAMLNAWKARASYVPTMPVKAWVFVILTNHILSQKRRTWRMVYSDDGEWTRGTSPDNPETTIALRQTIAAMCDLPLDQIDAIMLIARGHTYEAAADALGTVPGTIKSRVARGRRALREATE